MTDRLGLLRAILANPADDLPRLVYADWLEENGTTDADAARAELIRLWFRPKGGPRTATKIFAAWLKTNGWRLWPATAAAADPARSKLRAQGRCLTAELTAVGATTIPDPLRAYFDRGFATEVFFERDRGYQHFWRAMAIDEPLAEFEPQGLPSREGDSIHFEYGVTADFWGPDVYARVAGFDRIEDGATKVFVPRSSFSVVGTATPRARNAIRAAMTALAREANGLTPPPTESA